MTSNRPADLLHEGGWVKLERRIYKNDSVCRNYLEASVWAYLFANAEHRQRQRRTPGRGRLEVTVPRGFLLITISDLATGFETSRDKIRSILRFLKEANRIEMEPVSGHPNDTLPSQQAARHGWMVKILNYEHYQTNDPQHGTSSLQHRNGDPDSLLKKEEERSKKERKNLSADADSSTGTVDDRETALVVTLPKRPKNEAPMAAIWNEICGDRLPRARLLTEARRAALGRRYEDLGGTVEAWRAFCRKVRASPHLTGENDRGWTASLDWCLKTGNFIKIEEGNYDARNQQATRRPETQLQQFVREADERAAADYQLACEADCRHGVASPMPNDHRWQQADL